MEEIQKTDEPVLLFDGVCNLCNNSVQFILKHEKNHQIKFAAIQSEAGQKLLSRHNIDPDQTDSVILIKNGEVFIEFDAVLTISQFLKFPWSLGRVFIVIPKPIKHFIYRKIARNRYNWFGKRESCMMPAPALRNRFLK